MPNRRASEMERPGINLHVGGRCVRLRKFPEGIPGYYDGRVKAAYSLNS